MTLQAELDALKAQSRTRIPEEAQAIMRRAVEDLRKSGILDRVPKVGAKAPEFTLPNVAGQPVSSRALLAKGPLVVSFYRGKW